MLEHGTFETSPPCCHSLSTCERVYQHQSPSATMEIGNGHVSFPGWRCQTSRRHRCHFLQARAGPRMFAAQSQARQVPSSSSLQSIIEKDQKLMPGKRSDQCTVFSRRRHTGILHSATTAAVPGGPGFSRRSRTNSATSVNGLPSFFSPPAPARAPKINISVHPFQLPFFGRMREREWGRL